MNKPFLTMLVLGTIGVSYLSAQKKEHDWTKMITFDYEAAEPKISIYSDDAGNIYSTFLFQSDIHIGRPPKKKKDPEPPILSTENSLYGIYLDKRDGSGNVEWAKVIRLGDPQKVDAYIGFFNTCTDLVVAGGNIYITGTFDYNIDFGNGVSLKSEGRSDMYIAKINTSGDAEWAIRAGGSENAFAENDSGGALIAADGKGGIFATGTLNAYPNGGGTIGGQPLDLSKDGAQAVLIKVSEDGKTQWVKKAAAGTLIPTAGLEVDNSGNIYIGGSVQFFAEWGGNKTPANGLRDAAILKLDADGNHLWSKVMGFGDGPFDGKTLDAETVNLMTVSGNGNVTAIATLYDGAEVDGTKINVDKKSPIKTKSVIINLDSDGKTTNVKVLDGSVISLINVTSGYVIGERLFFKVGPKVTIGDEKTKEGLYSVNETGQLNFIMKMQFNGASDKINVFNDTGMTINSDNELMAVGKMVLFSDLLAITSKKVGERYQRQIDKNYIYDKDFNHGVAVDVN